jgi:hypothetical protein
MKDLTMIDVWDKFTLEEKQAMCVALQVRYDEKRRINTSIGGLALISFHKVKEAVGNTASGHTLGLPEPQNCFSLWAKLHQIEVQLDSQ